MRYLYSLLALILLPFALLKLLVRGLKDRRYLNGGRQRLGFPEKCSSGKSIWVHAVSVGEVRAVSPLINQLLTRYPDRKLYVSTTTPTGAQMVYQLFGERVQHNYFPYDIPFIVTRYLNALNPSLVVIVETEIWPNLYHACKAKEAPLCLINARLSARSLHRYQFIRPLIKDALNKTAFISAKSEEDRERFVQLGADKSLIKMVGNIKFDFAVTTQDEDTLKTLSLLFTKFHPVWLAASTHEGEEKQALDAHASICLKYPEALLILVPRHPERAADMVKLCEGMDLQVSLTSAMGELPVSCNVLVCDQLGLLVTLYQVADIAYIGGSLVPHGGHNPLEAAMFRLPIMTGPHTWNFTDVYPLLFAKNAALLVNDARELSEVVLQLADDHNLRRETGLSAYNVIEKNKGATNNIVDFLEKYIS